MADVKINAQTGEIAVPTEGGFRVFSRGQYKFNPQTNEYAVPVNGGWELHKGQPGPTKASAEALAPVHQGTVFERPNALAQGGNNVSLRENFSDPLTRTTGALGNLVDWMIPVPGAADELLAGIHSMTGKNYDQELARLQQARRDYNAQNNVEGAAASAAGAVLNPLNLAGGEFIAAGKTALNQSARGAGLGSAYGGAGGYFGTDGDADQRLVGAGIGAGIGGFTGGALPLMGAIMAPKVNPDVALLRSKGINMTPGQIMGGATGKVEEKLSSIPIAGDMMASGRRRSFEDLNRAVIDDVLAPIGKKGTGEIGRKAVAEVERTIGNEYDRVLSNVTFVQDQQLTNEVAQLQNLAATLPDREAQQFARIIADIDKRLQGGTTMSGKDFKIVDAELGKLKSQYGQTQDAYVNQLGEVVGDLQQAFRDSLPRTNPMQAGPLNNANAAWAKFKRLQRAVSYVGTKDTEPGVFNPDQFQSAVKALDSSKDKGAFARGSANMQQLSDAAKNVLGNRVPDSGTPTRLAMMIAGTGGLGVVEPTTLAATSLMTLPYLPGFRNAVQSAMTHQGPVADALRYLALRAAGMAGPGGGAIAGPNSSVQVPAR